MFSALWFLSLLSLVSSQNLCKRTNLSPPKRHFCNTINHWDQESRKLEFVERGRPGRPPDHPNGTERFQGFFQFLVGSLPRTQSIYDCLTISCICSFIRGARFTAPNCRFPDGSIYKKVVRKEYRILTDTERETYRRGFLAVRNTIYKTLSLIHTDINQSPGAHAGPAFLPWHREFVKRLEIGIRTTPVRGKYPYINVAIPYWDSSMDNDMYVSFRQASSKWSVMFTNELMGSVLDGNLTDGQFGGFRGTLGPVLRLLDSYPEDLTLMKKMDIETVVNTHSVNQVLAATAGDDGCPLLPDNNLEIIHGDPHVWIGGNMEIIVTSTNDPLFFLHHSFIDYIWERWRLNKQTRAQRESQYNTGPPYCYADAHRRDSVMTPFSNFLVEDGLRNAYTDNLYSYQAVPSCSSRKPCPSRFYFCNAYLKRCSVRVRNGGNCRLFGGVDPCYKSVCSLKNGKLGKCVAAASRRRLPNRRNKPRRDNQEFNM